MVSKRLDRVSEELEEYFAGKRRSFALPLAPQGTPFQQQVWWELANIPFGGTISYADLAQRLGRPTATRAVGAANGRNPIPIVLPCPPPSHDACRDAACKQRASRPLPPSIDIRNASGSIPAACASSSMKLSVKKANSRFGEPRI